MEILQFINVIKQNTGTKTHNIYKIVCTNLFTETNHDNTKIYVNSNTNITVKNYNLDTLVLIVN